MRNTIEKKKLSIILPTYNEKENIVNLYSRLKSTIDHINIDYEIIFVDDNSPDGTIEVIKKLRIKDNNVKYILMSRRYGDQISLMAGIDFANGDIVITMDSDLQHPPEYIPQMIDQWKEGAEIVIMKREKEGHKNFIKKWSEILFYKILGKISDTNIYYRFAGFALMDKKVVENLRKYKESEPFFRGLISLVGFKHTELYYKEEERDFGKSKYHSLDMIRLAITGITSFSEVPLYFSFYMGLIVMCSSFIYILKILIQFFVFQIDFPQGWSSTIVVVVFFGGIQLFFIGLLGIYVSKIFIETKKRPNYIIAESSGINDD